VNPNFWQPKAIAWPSIEGSPTPLGVTYIPEERAFNFALYSKNAREVILLLYSADAVSYTHLTLPTICSV